jgi:hypothetical protein
MSIRKRLWTSTTGDHSAWIADYRDRFGKRHIRTFKSKRAAARFHAKVVILREQSRLSDEQILELHFGLTKGRLP